MNVEIVDKPMKASALHLVECPRDAMQGWKEQIPTEQKVRYINSLLKVGFDTIDFGSFVSPKAVPQMADTKEVLEQLNLDGSRSGLLAIVANTRGAEEAIAYEQISYLGFPFSISETFQQKNTNSSIAESVKTVDAIQNLCLKNSKQLVIYLSMGFGNPYGDPYNEEILLQWADEMVKKNIGVISLADTVGLATPEQIGFALNALIPTYKETDFGVHLHSAEDRWKEKLQAAIDAGCRRVDGALKGIGGCPMAGNELVGNMRTEWVLEYMEEKAFVNFIDREALQASLEMAGEIFAGEGR
jgi:hydroxymethylglutaryl-CoA lyase